ncbi:MAG: polyprenyl synthetase family protein [Bdellovibrionaceae bacterium]|nr:polyprenyl synthetase family protein [Pseudobdellovibrionaceae bacterium]
MIFTTPDLKIYSSQDFPAYLPKLNSLYDDLFSGGKGFRSQLVKWISQSLSIPSETQKLLAQTIEFIHNASLLHDDLVDRSHLRRGKPAAWTKYTPEYAVLAGDYLLARVMVNLSKFGNIELVQYTAEMISDLLEGEWLQDSVVGDFFIQLEQLNRIHELKTASLFKWCLKAPLVAIQYPNRNVIGLVEELGSILGQLFQRSDDLLDYDVRNGENKAILGDLKSKYLNSFGSFVCQGKSKADIERLVQSQSLGEFKVNLGGEATFEALLKEFDAINSQKIQLYFHLLEKLKEQLQPSEVGMIEFLRPLPDLLYWRRK